MALNGMPLHRGQAEQIANEGMKYGMAQGYQQGQQAGLVNGYQQGAQDGYKTGADDASAAIMSGLQQNTQQAQAGIPAGEPQDVAGGQVDPRMEMTEQVVNLMIASQNGDKEAQAQLEQAIPKLQTSEEGQGILEYASQLANQYFQKQQGNTVQAGVPA